jgi:cyclic dehypoxanthinyl futalosine synthase
VSTEALLEKACSGGRLSREDALGINARADLFQLAQAAQRVRTAKHPDQLVTYVVDRNINYSNICICGCTFCAFYRAPGQAGGFVISREELWSKIRQTLELGGTQILLQGSHHPDLALEYFEELLTDIKRDFPRLHIHAFSPPEIVHLASCSGLSIETVLSRLIDAGLDSIPGGGAEILVDRVRTRISPNKCLTGDWLEVMRRAHSLGLKTTATMMFGHVETAEERIEHLLRLRELQDETGGFTAFIPWSFQPDNTALKARPATSVEYLKLLALSRLVLDNLPNIQVSWVTMGDKIAQLGLFFGANDFGSTMIEENVVAASGVRFRMSRQEIETAISAAGFTPRQRSMDYRILSRSRSV